ncbi:GntR family transcriptional regulator [Streptomyces sp. NBC_00391]|uniref:GntR family transcriptional regulator n=1 Tax=Streptomyces sp. NBC_00391 TaxID=2903647 RepID=UPI002E2060A3
MSTCRDSARSRRTSANGSAPAAPTSARHSGCWRRRGWSRTSATAERASGRTASPRPSGSRRCGWSWRGWIAARATERVGRAQAERLRGIGAGMAGAVDGGEPMTYSDLNARLHRCVRDIAGHETADQVLERLRAQVVRHQFALSLVPGRARVSLPQHQRIIEAIIAKDPTAAEAAMRDHVATAVEALRMLGAGRHRAS